MADTLVDGDECVVKRFACDCGSQKHCLDICMELMDDKVVYCVFNLYMISKTPLKYRLKQIWNLLRGKDGQLADFDFRLEDAPELLNLVARILNNPNTSGT